MMAYEIRDFREDDYEPLTALLNAANPEYPTTPGHLRDMDRVRPERCEYRRLLAHNGNREPVGVIAWGHDTWVYDPATYTLSLDVDPQADQAAVAGALYGQVIEALAGQGPVTLLARVREDQAPRLRFLQEQGFREFDRDFESRLDPAQVDLSAYAGLEARLQEQGIRIETLANLKPQDPEFERKLYELDWEASQDVPTEIELTQPTFEEYRQQVFENARLIPEAFFVAVDEAQPDRFVGTSTLWRVPADATKLNTGFTGVARAYRRRGIALALKLRALAYAQAHGNPTIKTWNAQNNVGMLAINEKLGFVRQPAWINMKKAIHNG